MCEEKKNKFDGLGVFVRYSPILIVVIAYMLSYNVFVTPVALERRLNEFNEHIETIYATKSETSRQQKQLDDIFLKIDKIYDYIIDKK